jgi:hypothetical protein
MITHLRSLLLLSMLVASSFLAVEAKTLTLYEDRVKPYLLEDVKNEDEWPSNGWELFGMTEAEIRARYKCGVDPKVTYTQYTGGGHLSFNYGQCYGVFDVVCDDDGKVQSLTKVIASYGLPAEGNTWHLNDRNEALHDALNRANHTLSQRTNDKTCNPGFVWQAYRERARIYQALGRNLEALKDINAAQYYEVQILKDPKKAKEDHRLTIYI